MITSRSAQTYCIPRVDNIKIYLIISRNMCQDMHRYWRKVQSYRFLSRPKPRCGVAHSCLVGIYARCTLSLKK